MSMYMNIKTYTRHSCTHLPSTSYPIPNGIRMCIRMYVNVYGYVCMSIYVYICKHVHDIYVHARLPPDIRSPLVFVYV